ncbi:sensor histidine kinase [Paenibacillus sacheonensis]|uniref:histidine kinase n=1 Tax=Paenibacillus sacheonensis TaxID=742054 RepID=A0A7X4YUB7_9BACL|nr:HAMP domain-containing sensor histidine kinase [Paenibacillus sacheonensis]MBM7569110.1 signal transduction histidine kinase [Paenibacillus sacheonensis]NBC72716.1 HAMP domain-containing protein [Paenibacillus sacheonensis]
MKFWLKIFSYSIVVFILIFNATSLIVVERNHSKMLTREINNALSQNMNIHSSVDAIIPIVLIYDSDEYAENVLANIAKGFVGKVGDQGVYMTITNDKGKTIDNNTDFEMPLERSELEQLKEDEIKYILRDIGERTILFTANLVEINQKKYTFTYMKDISSVYRERADQYSFYLKVNIIACSAYMLLMFFVSKRLTIPIYRLNRTAQRIAAGGFSERAETMTKDEIGVLAHNFNVMASVVEDKITDLERLNREKQLFIDNFTHELKTPLTSIIGYANFLRTAKTDPSQLLEGLEVILSEGKRLESLSFKLMDLIMLEGTEFPLEELDFCAILAEIKPALELRASEKRMTLRLYCEHARLKLEKDLIKVLIFNFVDNSIKASTENQCITIRAFRQDGDYVLEIEDEGIGIASEHLDRIFEPFYMTDKARTRGNHGAGLGLSICNSIARLHHAAIGVRSQPNRGTTFSLTFGTGGGTR